MEDKRLQLELREVIDSKLKEGYEVKNRDPYVVLQRGVIEVGVLPVGSKVIIRNEK